MEAFDFINDVAQWVGDLMPRWDLLEPTHGGVKFKPGAKVEQLEPGHIYWWWPATTKICTIEIKRQPLSFGQRLTTKDHETVQATIAVIFTIDDVIKAIVDTKDFNDTIVEAAQKLAIKPITSRSFDEIVKDMSETNDLRNEVTREARKVLSQYGINVEDAYVSDFTKTKVFSHDGEGFTISNEEDEYE